MPNEENPTNVVSIVSGGERNGNNRSDERAVNVARITELVRVAFYERYRIVRDDGHHLSCAKVIGPGVLQPIDNEGVINDMIGLLMGHAPPSLIKSEVFPTWRVIAAREHPVRATEIAPLVFKSDTTTPWSWQRLPFDPVEIEIPDLLTKMLARTSVEEARSMVLWLGSLLDYSYPRLQYLYMHGPGNDGKSTLIAMLIKLLGTQGVANMSSDDFADTHSTTKLEGARLALFTDENSSSFMSRGRFKSLVGDNMWTINPKGESRRNIRLHCKVMIASNNPPHVQGGGADLRRIVPVQFSPIPDGATSDIEGDAFVAAGPDIMQYCYMQFKGWYADNLGKRIPISENAINEVIANSMQADTDAMIDAALDFIPEGRTSAALLNTALRAVFGPRQSMQYVYQALKRRGAYRIQAGQGRVWTWVGVSIKPFGTRS